MPSCSGFERIREFALHRCDSAENYYYYNVV